MPSGVLHGKARLYPDDAASGGKGVAYVWKPGDNVSFSGVGPARKLVIHYASKDEGHIGLYVNGNRVADVNHPPTGDWTGKDHYRDMAIDVDIPAGATIRLQFDDGDRAANLDYLILK